MREIPIGSREEGQKLIRFLEKYLPNASKGFLYKMLRKKNIKLNEKKADGQERLKQGDRLQIYFSQETLRTFRQGKDSSEKPRSSGLRSQVRLLYRNEDILAFHKPAGMLSQRAASSDDSMNDYLIDYCLREGILKEEELEFFRPSVANRLDRNTSGIVLCGISIRGLQALTQALRHRTCRKYYSALVCGRMQGNGRLEGYLTRDPDKNVVRLSEQRQTGSHPAETAWKVEKACGRASLLSVELITGKTHQIRAHLASLGHPVLGDYKYGIRRENERLKKETGIARQLLHCQKIVLPQEDPLPGCVIADPVPEDFGRAMRWAGLY